MTGLFDRLLDRIGGREASVAPRLSPAFGPDAIPDAPGSFFPMPEPALIAPPAARAAALREGRPPDLRNPDHPAPRPFAQEAPPSSDDRPKLAAPAPDPPPVPRSGPPGTLLVPAEPNLALPSAPGPAPVPKIAPPPQAPASERMIETRIMQEIVQIKPGGTWRAEAADRPPETRISPEPLRPQPPLPPVAAQATLILDAADPAHPANEPRAAPPERVMEVASKAPFAPLEPPPAAIRIEIGTVEIHARGPAAATPARRGVPARQPPELSLEGYLAGKKGRP